MMEQFAQQATGLTIGRFGRAHHDGGCAEVGVLHVERIEGCRRIFFEGNVEARQSGRGFDVARQDITQPVDALLGQFEFTANFLVQRLDHGRLQAGPGVGHTFHDHGIGADRTLLCLGDQGHMHQTLLCQEVQGSGRFS